MSDEEKRKRQFDAFRRFIMPTLGVAEAIATQGKSPGTTALAVEQNYQNAEDRQQQFRRQAEEDALRRKAFGIQEKSASREEEQYGIEKGRREAWEAGVDRLPGLSEIERLALRGSTPQEGIRYLVEKGKPDMAQALLEMRLQGQQDLLKQKQEWEEAHPKPSQTPKQPPGSKPVKLSETQGKLLTGLKMADKAGRILDQYGNELTLGLAKGGVMKLLKGKVPETPINTEFRSTISSARGLMFSYLIGAGQTESEAKRLSDSYFDINQDPGVIRGKIETAKQFFLTGLPQGFDPSATPDLPIQSKIPKPGTGSTGGEPSSGQTPPAETGFTPEKKKRLEELRAKKVAGTLR